MINIKQNYPLDTLNTFHLPATARYYASVKNQHDVEEIILQKEFNDNSKLILGGGSNILFTRNYDGFVLQSGIIGTELVYEDDNEVSVRVGSGMEWDDFVAWCVDNNYGGVENLSAIPGTVGAAPVQNIGAYGVEAKDVIEKVEGFDCISKEWLTYSNDTCLFDYRNSIFKIKYKNSFLVTYVTFRLSKTPHTLITHYGAIEEELNKTKECTIATLRKVIIAIREAKLPDVDEIGNAGSFFKNPVVPDSFASELQESHPDIPAYPAGENQKKLSAAWLIDHAGLKGFSLGNAGTHVKQPLVLVNKGGATGKEVWELAKHIQNKVKTDFGILLEPEVNVY